MSQRNTSKFAIFLEYEKTCTSIHIFISDLTKQNYALVFMVAVLCGLSNFSKYVMGPSINDVTRFLRFFSPPSSLSLILLHTSGV